MCTIRPPSSSTSRTIDDVRIDAKHLIGITSHLDGRGCFIRCKVALTVNGVTHVMQEIVSLRYIRARVLELLSHAVNTNRRILHSSPFDFDINGKGEACRLKYTLVKKSKSIYRSSEYNWLPCMEAVEAEYGVLAEEHWMAHGGTAPTEHFPWFRGNLTLYISYLQAVAKKSPAMRKYSDDHFAKKWFSTPA